MERPVQKLLQEPRGEMVIVWTKGPYSILNM